MRDMTQEHVENPEDCIGEPVEVNYDTGEVTPLGSSVDHQPDPASE